MKDLNFLYTKKWFDGNAKRVWDSLISQINPTRILEIGSYEGASACYLIEKLGVTKKIELHCVDTWEGGIEHKQNGIVQSNMASVEQRFHHNIKVASSRVDYVPNITIHKNFSDLALAKLISDGKQGYFDFIYVDGAHQAPDVLCDAILSFKLLKKTGVLTFDDYLWSESSSSLIDPLRCPKIAIDAFTNIYCRKIKILSAPLYQLYVQKLSD